MRTGCNDDLPKDFHGSLPLLEKARGYIIDVRDNGGGSSYGSTGNPLFIPLESGGSVRICTRRNTHIDGREFINTGVLPHVYFAPSIDDLRGGRDVHMEKGLEVLRGLIV